jgi:REP element-mobilizing transposase RayT
VPYNPWIHHRRSIRLPDHDYSAGSYFVTLVVNQRLCVLGSVENGRMNLNDAGTAFERWWRKLPERFLTARLGEYVIMPNHLHAIVDLAPRADIWRHTLGELVAWFKTMSTNEYIRGVHELGWEPFPSRLWQRNYWEHVIRDSERPAIERYIRDNAANWKDDEDNPARTTM